jgi:hypothetical protein
MPALPKRIAGVRVPKRLRRKRGLALIIAGLAAVFLTARKKAAALAR